MTQARRRFESVQVEVIAMFSNRPDRGQRLDRLLQVAQNGRRMPKPRTVRKVFRRLTANEVTQLVEVYVGGTSQREVARHFRIHPQTVAATLDRAGVIRRNPGLHGDRLEKLGTSTDRASHSGSSARSSMSTRRPSAGICCPPE